MRRRETTMNRGLLSGERVDLVKIVDGLKLTADAKKPVDSVLEQYQVDLDRELIARNDVQDKMQGNFRDLMQDPDKAEKAFQDGRAAATKLRDVNKRYSRQVENALPDDTTKAKFEEEVHKASFPMIYRNSRTNRTIDAALKLETLSPEQKSSINTIKDSFNKELGGLRSKMETAYESREQSVTAADMMGRFGGGNRGGGGDTGGGQGGGRRGGGAFGPVSSPELDTLSTQQDDLEKATTDKINAILTPEQKAELPQQGQGGRGGRRTDGGNDNGGGGGTGGGGNRPRGGRPGTTPAPAPSGRT
jgi:uncharacterized membrane protein YgcG